MNARRSATIIGGALLLLATRSRAQEAQPGQSQEQQQAPAPNRAANEDLAKARDQARKPSRDTEQRAMIGLELDHAFLRMYDMALQTTGARLGLGIQNEAVGALFIGDFGVGSLGSSGLKVSTGSLGFELLFRALTFVRLGGGARLGYLNVSRVTSPSPMEALSIGGFVSAKVDVYNFGARDDHGVYLGGRIDLDTYQGHGQGGPFIWGPQLFAGFRY